MTFDGFGGPGRAASVANGMSQVGHPFGHGLPRTAAANSMSQVGHAVGHEGQTG